MSRSRSRRLHACRYIVSPQSRRRVVRQVHEEASHGTPWGILFASLQPNYRCCPPFALQPSLRGSPDRASLSWRSSSPSDRCEKSAPSIYSVSLPKNPRTQARSSLFFHIAGDRTNGITNYKLRASEIHPTAARTKLRSPIAVFFLGCLSLSRKRSES